MAFTWAKELIQFGSPPVSSVVNDLITEIRDNLDETVGASNLQFPDATASTQFTAMLLNAAKDGFDLTHVLRSDGAIQFFDSANLADQDLIYYDNGNSRFTRLAKGADGTSLQLSGGNLIWATVASVPSPTSVTSDTTSGTPLAENTINVVTGASVATLHLPTSPAVTMKPLYFFPADSWAANTWTLNGNGTNIAGAATQLINANSPFAVYYSGTQYELIIYGGSVS